ncbi:MAG: transposase family protein [Chloroflexi bacterium]|nr:MAG: transposase family protein [Chloroflexota bacterium]
MLPAYFPCLQDDHWAKSERKAGGGRKGTLASIEQKLLFALVYQKSYPVQSIMGELFGMDQSQANAWIHTFQ